jgi:hypothetical protein|tara:strand:+ start:221 stop:709 length:489 start_codon:yes stop_codon:yes gene_type:complete
MFTKENVISAKLINEEHTTIEVVHTIEGDDKVHSYILEYDKDSQDFKALEKAGWDLERVTEETVAYKRDTSRIYDESIHTAAMKFLHENPPEEVVIERIENIKVDDIIGSIISKNEDEDMLFRAKLAVMELPAAKASKKTKVKQDIRKAKSLIELISNISKL